MPKEKPQPESPATVPADDGNEAARDTESGAGPGKLVRCPSCRAEIESEDVAHFDAHKEYEERLTRLEQSRNAEPGTNEPRRVRFDFNPYMEDDATESEGAETPAHE